MRIVLRAGQPNDLCCTSSVHFNSCIYKSSEILHTEPSTMFLLPYRISTCSALSCVVSVTLSCVHIEMTASVWVCASEITPVLVCSTCCSDPAHIFTRFLSPLPSHVAHPPVQNWQHGPDYTAELAAGSGCQPWKERCTFHPLRAMEESSCAGERTIWAERCCVLLCVCVCAPL